MLGARFTTVFISLVAVSAAARPPLVSPFASTVPEISIPNTHLVSRGDGFLLRGMMPRLKHEVDELGSFGVTDVLIFRNDVPGESAIQTELELLARSKVPMTVHQIPFRWKEIVGFTEACQQSVQALKLLKAVHLTKGRGLFFHCTVGEDRTGYLAGLYRVLFEKRVASEVFQSELCAKGFADGNPEKPKHVIAAVHANLAPLYFKMISLMESGALNAETLGEAAACATEPQTTIDIPSCASPSAKSRVSL